MKQAMLRFEQELRHALFPDYAYLTKVPDFDLFGNTPTCEFHFKSTGAYQHIVQAILYHFEQVLRRDDLVTHDGRPLVRDSRLANITNRLQRRIRSLKDDEIILSLPPSFIDSWSRVFLSKESGSKMNGDHYKRTMLIFGFLIRDLITPEV